MIRILAFFSVCLLGLSVPLIVQADQASYTNFSIKSDSWIEVDEQAVNTKICFEGVKVGSINLYRNCARLKAAVSKKAKSLNQQHYSIIFETQDTQLDFESNSKGGNGNYKFWMRERSAEDTPPRFSNFLRKFDQPKQIMIGAMCSKFADDAWLKEGIRKSLKSSSVSQGVSTQINWDRAFRAWNTISTRCYRLASRRVGSALTMQAAPKPKNFAACGLTWDGNSYSMLTRKAIQAGLKKRKILDGAIDGKFGPKTCAAVEKFLSVEGRVPKKTFDAYELYLIRKDPSQSTLKKYQVEQDVCSNYANNASVKKLQSSLKAAGIYRGEIDGLVGSGTKSAVERAERLLGSQIRLEDGCLDPQELRWVQVLGVAREAGIYKCDLDLREETYLKFAPNLQELGYTSYMSKIFGDYAKRTFILGMIAFEKENKSIAPNQIQKNCTLGSNEKALLDDLIDRKKQITQQGKCRSLADAGEIGKTQKILSKAGFYVGTINVTLDKRMRESIQRAETSLAYRATQQDGCLDETEKRWLTILGEARSKGIYQCSLNLRKTTFLNFAPKLKDLGYLDMFSDEFIVLDQQNFVASVLKFENDEFSNGSKQIKRNCSLDPIEEIELERLWQIKTKTTVDTTPDATKLSETYTLQMAQNLITDLEGYLKEKGFNPFGVKLATAYAKVRDVSNQAAWSDQDKKNFKALKDLILSNSEFSLYHSAQVSERTTMKSRMLNRLRALIDNLIADGTLFMQTNPLLDSASKVADVIKEIQKVRDQTEVSTLLKAIQKTEQQYESLSVPFRKIEFRTDDLLLTDEQKALVEQIRSAQERRQTAALQAAAQAAENERIKQEAKLKEEELKKARALAENKERDDKVKRYKLEAATLLQDIREYVRAGNQFDISLPKYLQEAKGAEKADEWSAELISGYEQLLSYANKFDKFRQFRNDKEKQRELQKQKLLADLRADRIRILKELEEWIKANPFSEAAATLVSVIDEYAKEEETDDIGIMEERLAALIEKVRASGVELPISELFERRGYSLDGANEPLAPANVITTLSDAQQYVKDVQNFVKENPTVFGPELVKLYNGIRSLVDQDEWNNNIKSAFSSFEAFTGKQSLFTAFRKSEINKRAQEQKLALERLRKALLQLLADGSLYIQNNQFAENALTIYQAVEFGRSVERNTDPSDLLKAVDKIKKVYNENSIPFADTLIEIEFLVMSDEEIRIVNEMNEAYRLRTAELKAQKNEIEELNKEIVKDKIATELANTKSEAAIVETEKDIAEKGFEILDVKIKTFEKYAAEMRLEAQNLVADARNFVEQGNRFGLEFILLNAGIAGFEVESWQQPLFDNYIEFRNYVLENEEFVSFRERQIESREKAALKAFEDLVNELELMKKSLEDWVLKNQIDPKAADAFGIYQELARINADQPETISNNDVLRLKADVKAIGEKLAKLSIPGVYVSQENPTTLPSSIPDPDPTPEEIITLESAQNTLADVKNYIQTGQGTFDSKKLPLLFAKIRDIEKGVWNPKMEQAALEFSQFVLRSNQFSEYHAQQNKKRREEIQAQKEEISRKIKSTREALFEWLANNPFDERAVSVANELENLESALTGSNDDGMGLPLESLSRIFNGLQDFVSRSKVPIDPAQPAEPEPTQTGADMVPPSTKFIFVNLSGSATHAIRNLDGKIVFEKEQADYCYAMITPLQKVDRFYLRKLIGERTKAPQFEALSPCSVANISTMDLIITDGRAINEGNLAVKSATEMGYEKFAEVAQVEIEAEAERDLILVENLKDDLEQGVRAGFGYVVNNNSSSVGCLTIDGSEDAHSILISQAEDRINLYRDTRVSVFEFMSIDQAFSQWQRGRCGVVYANADDLSRFIESLKNNQDDFDLSPEWFSAKKVDKIQNTIKTRDDKTKRAIETRRRELELQKKLEEEAREQAISEADQKQAELREIYGPRVKGLKEAFESEMNLVLDQLLEKNTSAETPDYLGKFKVLDDVITFHTRRDWEETERRLSVVDYGVAKWSDRDVEANIIRAMVNVKNRTLGKYKEICFDLGYIWDQEFEMIRDPFAMPCSDGGIANWKNKQTFKSRWNVTLQ